MPAAKRIRLQGQGTRAHPRIAGITGYYLLPWCILAMTLSGNALPRANRDFYPARGLFHGAILVIMRLNSRSIARLSDFTTETSHPPANAGAIEMWRVLGLIFPARPIGALCETKSN